MTIDQPKWTGHFKIVQPTTNATRVTDNASGDSSLYNNYSWYQRLVHGSSSRLSRYQEYDSMDQDVDISRALDLVAEEMTPIDQASRHQLKLDLFHESDYVMEPSTVTLLHTLLQHWYEKTKMSVRLFKIARTTIKYGDTFFRKLDNGSWLYIHPKNVVAAFVDEKDVNRVIGYQIRADIKEPRQEVVGGLSQNQETVTELVSADEIVRFTLNDDMDEQAPFGESTLSCVYRTHKQKELLEDAIIIYRVQRAPERRVFYIDVGKMPPQRTKNYLETIKNEIRQKKVPSVNGGINNVESTYNPQSMSEDFFFAVRPNSSGGSRVETLPGGQNLGELTDLEYFRTRVMEGLRIPPSYLPNFSNQELSGQFGDGNPATSYMQEIQFSKYVIRLQNHMNATLDEEFKAFVKELDIKVDPTLYKVSLADTTNYEDYRTAAINGDLLNMLASADGVQYLSKRMILKQYLRWSDADIATNETLLAAERGLTKKDAQSIVRLYNPDEMDIDETNDFGGGGVGSGTSGFSGVSDVTSDSADDTNTPDAQDSTPAPNTPVSNEETQ